MVTRTSRRGLCTAVLAALVACGDDTPVDTSAPEPEGTGSLSLSSEHLDFGTLAVGEDEVQSVALINEGDGPLTLYDVGFSDDAQRVNWLVEDLSTSSLESQESISLSISAQPVTVGDIGVDLVFLSDDPVHPEKTLQLSAEAEGVPEIDVEPETLEFGTVEIGETEEGEIYIANYGTDDLEITSCALRDPDDGSYALTLDPTGNVLEPGDENGLAVVSFTAQYDGTWYGYLDIQTNDPENPEVSVTLVGEGEVPE